MISLKKDTLAYQLGVRPGVQNRDMSGVPVQDVALSLNTFMTTPAPSGLTVPEEGFSGHPEVDALKFYMMNHAVSLIQAKMHPLEPLGKYLPLVDEYHKVLAGLSSRMFFYLLLICTRESRHAKNAPESSFITGLEKKYGSASKMFWTSIRGGGSSGAAEKFRKSPPHTSLGQYTKFLAELFHKGIFSSGYGGPAWGAVADVLRDYSIGVISAEMMMDTSFTLCHNNGPIFNKGMLFDSYSSEIYKILDVQRSGQIPQYVGNGESKWKHNKSINDLWAKCHSRLGVEFAGFVDWYKVEDLGSLKKYPEEKKQQKKDYGYPAEMKAMEAKVKAEKELALKKLQAEEKNWVTFMPNFKVKKVKVR